MHNPSVIIEALKIAEAWARVTGTGLVERGYPHRLIGDRSALYWVTFADRCKLILDIEADHGKATL